MAARMAYNELDKISKYYRTYRQKRDLMREAESLGISHILVKVENLAPIILPVGFEDEITRFGLKDPELSALLKMFLTLILYDSL